MSEAKKGRHTYLMRLHPDITIKISADYFSIDSNGVLSLGFAGQGDVLAYAPGAWVFIVKEGLEGETLL